MGKVTAKIVLDQMFGTPVGLAILFIVLGFLEGKNFTEIKMEAKLKVWSLYIAELIVGPAAQFINFYFFPAKYRVLYVNGVSLCSDSYISYVKHSPHFEENKKK